MSHVLVWYPNAALDHLIQLDHLQLGKVQRATQERHTPGGKGANILRALKILGSQGTGVTMLGGVSGALYRTLVAAEGIDITASEVQGETRSATLIIDSLSDVDTVINGPGPEISASDWRSQTNLIRQRIETLRPAYFIVTGSLPPGAAAGSIREAISFAAQSGATSIADVSGDVLEAALVARPAIVKINRDEALAFVRRRDSRVDHRATDTMLAASLCQHGAAQCVVTNGREEITSSLDGNARVRPPSVTIASAVGCGDAFLAGMVHGLIQRKTLLESIAWGAAVGSAAAERLVPAEFSVARAIELLPKVQY